MSAVVLGLAAGCLWGCGDFLGGLASRRAHALLVVLVSQLAGVLVLAALVAAGAAGAFPGWRDLSPGLVGGLLGFVALAAFYRGLAIGAMSIVAPLSATGAVVPLVVDLARGDRPGGLALAGMGLALAGAALAARAPGHASREGVGLAFVAALGFGGLLVLLAEASEESVVWGVLSVRMTSLPIALAAVLAVRAARAAPARALPPALAAGPLEILANLAYAGGTQRGLLSVVAVLGSLYPITTIALAQGLLGERTGRIQAAGVALALTGVVMIAAG